MPEMVLPAAVGLAAARFEPHPPTKNAVPNMPIRPLRLPTQSQPLADTGASRNAASPRKMSPRTLSAEERSEAAEERIGRVTPKLEGMISNLAVPHDSPALAI